MAEQAGAAGRQFIMHKTLTGSDVSRQQNRLLIPLDSFRERLSPILTPSERGAVERNGGSSGLDVKVFLRNGWRFGAQLARWRSSGAVVIKGKEYRAVVEIGGFAPGDLVRMSAYRAEDGVLCFELGKVVRV